MLSCTVEGMCVGVGILCFDKFYRPFLEGFDLYYIYIYNIYIYIVYMIYVYIYIYIYIQQIYYVMSKYV